MIWTKICIPTECSPAGWQLQQLKVFMSLSQNMWLVSNLLKNTMSLEWRVHLRVSDGDTLYIEGVMALFDCSSPIKGISERPGHHDSGYIIQETSWLNEEVSSVLPETVWYRQKHKAGTLIWKAKCQTFHRHTSSRAGWRLFFIILQPLFVCDVWDVRPWKTTYFRPAQMEPLVSTWHNHTTQTADCPLRCKMGSPPVRPEVRHL